VAMYRVLHTLDVGKAGYLYPGSFSRMEWLDARGIAALEHKGAISRVHAPPIMILPGWTERAEILAQVGIQDAEQFLEAEAETLADALDVEEKEVEEMREVLLTWLSADKPAPG